MHFTLHRIADRFSRKKTATVADITEAVRAARRDGLLPGIRQREAVGHVRELIAEHKENRRGKRSRTRTSPDPLAATLKDKAASRSLRFLRESYRLCGYRKCRQGHETRIKIGSPAATGGSVDTGERYSSRCYYRKQESVHTLTIPALWCVRVHARHLDVCDSMLTLDAKRVAGSGPELYEAVWVEQGRGTNIEVARGYIARIGGTTYHAKTAKAALLGVQRKTGQKPPRRKIDLDRLVRRYGTVLVTHGHRQGIACDSGSRSWCQAVGLDFDREALSVAEVVAGYKIRPMPEALAVIKRAVKDHRQWERVLSEPRGNVRFNAEGGFRVEG